MDVRFHEQTNPDDQSIVGLGVEFFARTLGAGYVTHGILQRDIVEKTSLVDFCWNKSDVAGVCMTRVLNHHDCKDSYVRIFQEYDVLPDDREFTVGLFGTVAVDSGFRGKGIGSELYRRSESFVREHGAEKMISLSWESGRVDSSGPLFQKMGFRKIVTIPEYWKEYSIKHNADCPNCGNPPCLCAASLMVRDLT